MICSYRVKFRKYAGAMEVRGEVVHMKNRVMVRGGDLVESTVVPTGAPRESSWEW